jgi:hypothetical protein
MTTWLGHAPVRGAGVGYVQELDSVANNVVAISPSPLLGACTLAGVGDLPRGEAERRVDAPDARHEAEPLQVGERGYHRLLAAHRECATPTGGFSPPRSIRGLQRGHASAAADSEMKLEDSLEGAPKRSLF